MKRAISKFLACLLAFSVVMSLATVSAFANSKEDFSKELDYIKSKGFLTGTVLSSEKIDGGVKFAVSYLSSGEVSYISYIDEEDGVKIVVKEGNIQNVVEYKDNGCVYLDGQRNKILEGNASRTNNVVPYAYATSYYKNFSDVPGYSYWRTQTFKNESPFYDFMLDVGIYITKNLLISQLTAGFGIPAQYSDIFSNVAESVIDYILENQIPEAALNISSTTTYIYNPTTLQYLYKAEASYTILNKKFGDTFYKLETYN